MLSAWGRELLRYLGNLVDKRMQEPKDDLISQLVTEQVKPGTISKEDAVQTAFLLLVAGNATTINMISLVSIIIKLRSSVSRVARRLPGRCSIVTGKGSDRYLGR